MLVFVCHFEKKISDRGTTNSLFYNTNVDCKVAPASKATLQEQVNIEGQNVNSAEAVVETVVTRELKSSDSSTKGEKNNQKKNQKKKNQKKKKKKNRRHEKSRQNLAENVGVSSLVVVMLLQILHFIS